MKKIVLRIIIGLLVSISIFALLFYFFLFANPVGIHQVNQLKWIPMLIVAISTFASGVINKNTPVKWLPILLLPLVLLKPFNYFYFPFILFALIAAIFMLIASRESKKNKNFAWTGAFILLIIFLFNQPLIIENEGFDFDRNGELVNATTLWDFSKRENINLPDHTLKDIDEKIVNLESLKGKIYFLTFWATWCAPCMEEKPELEKLKSAVKLNKNIEFIDISFDHNFAEWKEYLSDHESKGIQLYSENHQLTSRKLEFSGIPMHIIVDEEGTYKKYRSFAVAKAIIEQSN